MLYDNLAVNEYGHLTIAGVDALDLVKEYGAPLYVLDEDRIRKNARLYTESITKLFPPGSSALYAGKALCFRGIYPIIESEGMCADVVSPGEIYTAISAGFPAEKLFFHGNNKTDADIAYALDSGVGCFIVDNVNELIELDRQAGERGIRQDILLRVSVGIDPHTFDAVKTGKVDSQFGTPIETGQAEGIVKMALSCENVALNGFHSHIGSQIFESDPFCDQVDILLAFACDMRDKYGFTASVFNLGGGFGVRYVASDPVVNIPSNIAEIADHLNRGCEKTGFPVPRIYMEPGRSIVADAGVTLYETGGIKVVDGYRNYITVNGGMTDNPRFALYRSSYTVLNASRMAPDADEELFVCTVAGRCCESGDRIAEDIIITKPSRGDIIAVLTTGAYNYSMSSNYNKLPRPALVIVNGGESRLAVKRETFEDLVVREL